MSRITTSSVTIPALIKRLRNSATEDTEVERRRQRCTFTICMSTIAVRHAVVAWRYAWSVDASSVPHFQPAPISTNTKAVIAAIASIIPRPR